MKPLKLNIIATTTLVTVLAACGGQQPGAQKQPGPVTPVTPPVVIAPLPEPSVIDAAEIDHDQSTLQQQQQQQQEAKRQLHKAAGPATGMMRLLAPHSSTSTAADALAWQPTGGLHAIREASEPLDRENYAHFDDNPVKRVAENPVSTFSIDGDTGSYSNVRRMLNQGRLPVRDAVRVEELLNYFDYAYQAPVERNKPFTVTTELGPNPWNANSGLLHIGIQGYDVDAADIPASNLVFLIDVSGSMQSPDKLELLKKGLSLLSKQMREQDRIAIVVYAGASGIVLEPTAGSEQLKISQALAGLTAGGSTNGGAGIRLAYQVAESAFIEGGVNRILLATDGDFNVGTTSFEQLMDLVEEKRKSGIGLSTLGFGTGNYNDHLAEQLANRGNGSYAYIDTLNEANKVLVDQMSATLLTIARDVKIQIEFNPAVVSEYRLIGYQNRQLRREDFNNDKIDAGEIGAGHSVTALYEITLADSGKSRMDPLRYADASSSDSNSDELAYLKLRYKQPGASNSKLVEHVIETSEMVNALEQTSEAYRFAGAVAGFGQLLRGSDYTDSFAYDDVLRLSREARGKDVDGYRGEFIQLVKLARSLAAATAAKPGSPADNS